MGIMRVYRPTQDEVETKAAELFGPHWKDDYEEMHRVADLGIGKRLELARDRVIAERKQTRG